MTEFEARQLLLVRAYEDPPAAPWTEADAERTTAGALREFGVDERIGGGQGWLAARAARAAGEIRSRAPAAAAAWGATAWPRWATPAAALLAFVAGLAFDAIGTGHRLNLLAPPWLGVLAWNLLVYLVLIASTVAALRTSATRDIEGGQPGLRHAVVAVWARWARSRGASSAGPTKAADPSARFLGEWFQAARPLLSARAAVLLHDAAATFAVGLMASLYARGLAVEYRAGWDSTFLGPVEVARLLGWLYGPAASLSGFVLPDAATVAGWRFAEHPGVNAAPWIHLQAITLGWVVIAPRALLALASARQARGRSADFPLPLEAAYFQRLLRVRSGETLRVSIVPYSYQVPQAARPALEAAISEALGGGVALQWEDNVPLGGEDDLAPLLDHLRAPPAPQRLVVLFSLSATPEYETHGRFVASLAATPPRDMALTVVIDETGLRERLGPGGAPRLAERRAAWQRLLGDMGLSGTFVDAHGVGAAH